ncbi:glycosyltransferase [Terrilactibacillus laevilacticus]|uniref:glycosyltransferase n=1 Tax=Terrilactibacillus laevilacticus TaxID=1380157 RepID=UPI0011472ED1|nr:glycosyltransferase [Terrilactibacillus laevilacticus]
MIIDVVLGKAIGRGGLERVLYSISHELNKRGHRVRIFQISEPDYLDWADTLPEIYYYGKKVDYQLDGKVDVSILSSGYQKLISKIGMPDVALATHLPLFSLICRLALNSLKNECIPILSWLHNPPESGVGERLINYSDAHLAISHNMANKIKSILNINSPIYYVGNPLEIDNIRMIDRPKKYFKLIYIGRLENGQKRLDILFKALSKLKGDWRLHIIGDGPSIRELKTLSEQLRIHQNIIWEGWKEDPWDDVKEASLLVLSSDFEGFGLVLVEALARGIPVVSTNCEGPDEIIQHGENGWLFPIGDVNRLQSILQDIISGKIVLPESEVCRKSVLHYRTEVVIDRLEEVLLSYANQNKIKEKVTELIELSDSNDDIVQGIAKLLIENNINIDAIFSMLDDEISNNKKSEWLTQLGVLCWENEKLDYVIPAFQKAIEYVPNNSDALFNLGYVLKCIGETDLALHYFEQIMFKTAEVREQIAQIRGVNISKI